MKVKISYTVDLEDVPAEAGDLIDRALTKLDDMSVDYQHIKKLKEVSLHETIKEIDNLRLKIYEADLLLADSSTMLAGYLNTITTPKEEPVPNMNQPLSQGNGQVPLDDMKQALAALSKMQRPSESESNGQ
tara:strand:- start:3868 stop:4260 length:393 start_codon:yes stop_codon:yes gene_type:complete